MVNFFNWISYSDPSYTSTNSQYLSHIASIDLMILTLAMAAPQKQMWGHRPQHSHIQLNNHLPGMLDHGLTILTILLTCTNSGSIAACWREQLHYHATQSQISAWNKHTVWITKIHHGEKPPWGGFFSHSNQPHRSSWP